MCIYIYIYKAELFNLANIPVVTIYLGKMELGFSASICMASIQLSVAVNSFGTSKNLAQAG